MRGVLNGYNGRETEYILMEIVSVFLIDILLFQALKYSDSTKNAISKFFNKIISTNV